MSPTIKTRPNMPRLDELYTGVEDDAFSRIKSATRIVSDQAKAMGVGAGLEEFEREQGFYQESSGGYEFESDEEQRMAAVLSDEEPEAELNSRAASYYLYPDHGAIMMVNHRTSSVSVSTYNYEEDMYEDWDNCVRSVSGRD